MTCRSQHDETAGDIPRFLCACGCNPAPRGHNGGPAIAATYVDPVAEQQRAIRAAWKSQDEAKRKARLALHLEKHRFETWNPKLGIWDRDQRKIDAHHATMEVL